MSPAKVTTPNKKFFFVENGQEITEVNSEKIETIGENGRQQLFELNLVGTQEGFDITPFENFERFQGDVRHYTTAGVFDDDQKRLDENSTLILKDGTIIEPITEETMVSLRGNKERK